MKIKQAAKLINPLQTAKKSAALLAGKPRLIAVYRVLLSLFLKQLDSADHFTILHDVDHEDTTVVETDSHCLTGSHVL